ncbi:MAG: hypothetical protein HRF42_13405, partial [Candidatus Brocadia sp.]
MLIEFNPKIKIAILHTVNINAPLQYIVLFGWNSISILSNNHTLLLEKCREEMDLMAVLLTGAFEGLAVNGN